MTSTTAKTIRTFLIGTSLALGTVVGLAPAGHAAPVTPGQLPGGVKVDPCVLQPGGCQPKPPVVVDICKKHPQICVDVTKPGGVFDPGTGTPGTTPPPKGDPTPPKTDPKPTDHPTANPDTPVKGRAVFTG